MSNASSLFTTDALHLAARRGLARPARLGTWQRLRGALERLLQTRRDAAALQALLQFDEHRLRDIGADEEVVAYAAALRERREHPFAPNSLRGIEVASRRMNW